MGWATRPIAEQRRNEYVLEVTFPFRVGAHPAYRAVATDMSRPYLHRRSISAILLSSGASFLAFIDRLLRGHSC